MFDPGYPVPPPPPGIVGRDDKPRSETPHPYASFAELRKYMGQESWIWWAFLVVLGLNIAVIIAIFHDTSITRAEQWLASVFITAILWVGTLLGSMLDIVDAWRGYIAAFWNDPESGQLMVQVAKKKEGIHSSALITLMVKLGGGSARGRITSTNSWHDVAFFSWCLHLVHLNDNACIVEVRDGANRLRLDVRELLTLLTTHVQYDAYGQAPDLTTITCRSLDPAWLQHLQQVPKHENAEPILQDILDDIEDTRRFVKSKEARALLANALERYVGILNARGDEQLAHHYLRRLNEVTATTAPESKSADAAS